MLEEECCFPGVLCDGGDAPANLLCQLNVIIVTIIIIVIMIQDFWMMVIIDCYVAMSIS